MLLFMKKVKFICIFILLIFQVKGQNGNIFPLTVGDTLPNLLIKYHVNDSVSIEKLRDYKGKLVLLDFWGVNCLSCIEGMPHILQLQESLKDKIQVFVVTKDSEDDVKKLWTKLHNIVPGKILEAGKHLSFITSDTIFSKMFPTGAGIPMHVWIDANQIYRSSAYPNTTTEENIKSFLKGEQIKLATYYQPSIGRFELNSWFEKRIGFK